MRSYTNRKPIGRVTRERSRAKRDDLDGMAGIAFRAARRDNRPWFVGATAYGYVVGQYQDLLSSRLIQVLPTGEAFEVTGQLHHNY